MTLLKLALRNTIGAGTRTWLNVIVLSFSFVAIIWSQGLYEGVGAQVADAVTAAEIGGGQYWHANYDPFDPLTLQDAHGPLPAPLSDLVARGAATPVLVTQGSIYPGGRIQPVLLKGIDPAQKVLTLPSAFLAAPEEDMPALIGSRMAQNTGLKAGDYVTVQWRDVHGTFDAREAHIVQVMNTVVQSIDNGQVWLPLDRLQALTGMPGEATLVTIGRKTPRLDAVPGWNFKAPAFLLKDIRDVIRAKSVGSSVMFAILLFLAMLAIFDTQVLSVFRRRREMGTLMALGMTRWRIIRLFTLEGALYGVLAALVGAVYGIPLLVFSATHGFGTPPGTEGMGYAIGERIYPAYGAGLIVGTTVLVLIVTTIVSYLPTRRIARLRPTDALRGRFS